MTTIYIVCGITTDDICVLKFLYQYDKETKDLVVNILEHSSLNDEFEPRPTTHANPFMRQVAEVSAKLCFISAMDSHLRCKEDFLDAFELQLKSVFSVDLRGCQVHIQSLQ